MVNFNELRKFGRYALLEHLVETRNGAVLYLDLHCHFGLYRPLGLLESRHLSYTCNACSLCCARSSNFPEHSRTTSYEPSQCVPFRSTNAISDTGARLSRCHGLGSRTKIDTPWQVPPNQHWPEYRYPAPHDKAAQQPKSPQWLVLYPL
jgi:uncharacterized Zn-finger protein